MMLKGAAVPEGRHLYIRQSTSACVITDDKQKQPVAVKMVLRSKVESMLLLNTLQWESLVGRMFGEFTRLAENVVE